MRRMLMTFAALCWAGVAKAEGDAAGDFDYYVLSLSWSSAWCALEVTRGTIRSATRRPR